MIGLIFWLCVGLILYTYAGYPLLLTGLALLRERPSFAPPSIAPSVTLLISAYNEEAVIAAKLENAFALEYPKDRLRIVVAADGSDDRTVSIVESFAGRGVLCSYSSARAGKMRAIQHAIATITTDLVVFSDANNMYQPDFLARLCEPFSDPAVGATVGAKVIAAEDGSLAKADGLYWKYESFIKRQESRLGSCTGVLGEALAIRRGLFDAPPAGIINDDFFIAMRIVHSGYRIAYVPQARSYERVSPTAQDEVARRARIVAGRYQAIFMAHRILPLRNPLVAWQIISHKFLRPLVPLAMIVALLANLIAVVWPVGAAQAAWFHLAPPYAMIFLIFQAAFYLSAIVGAYTQRTPLGKALYLPTFLVQSNWAALIGLGRFMTGKQSPLWERIPRREGKTSI
jgi:poly-beta-1,6-N-acetyl-D-glucosamine synthase